MSTDVELESRGAVRILTIHGPDSRNALNPEAARAILAACDSVDADAECGALVVRGGGGHFCSGADRRWWDPSADQSADPVYSDASVVYQSFRRIGSVRVPTIAAVRGAAVGAGLNLMLATDLRVVAHDARIRAGFTAIGLHPGGGFFTLAARLGGRELAAALGVFGEELEGREAAHAGLAWRSVPDAEVDTLALDLAARAARDPLLAKQVARSFRTETEAPGMTWDVALEFERATQMWSQRRRTEK